jgi:hypothetical protein
MYQALNLSFNNLTFRELYFSCMCVFVYSCFWQESLFMILTTNPSHSEMGVSHIDTNFRLKWQYFIDRGSKQEWGSVIREYIPQIWDELVPKIQSDQFVPPPWCYTSIFLHIPKPTRLDHDVVMSSSPHMEEDKSQGYGMTMSLLLHVPPNKCEIGIVPSLLSNMS